MQVVNRVVGGIVGVLLYPLRELPPMVGLIVVSVLSGLGMLIVFRLTSNQEGIRAVKRRIAAGVFEIRLFNDDVRAILRAQVDILRHTLAYLGFTLVPIAWMIVPLLLLLIQLQSYYGYGPLEVGSSAIVTVRLKDGNLETPVALIRGSGARVETPRLWIPSQSEVDWRIRATDPGAHTLSIRIGAATIEKRLLVAGSTVRRAPVRVSGFWEQILHPVEAPLPSDGPVESVSVSYPARKLSVLGVDFHWVVVFFVLTMVTAFGLARPLRVSI